MRDIEKAVTLALIDDNWKEHLRSMDELKESVQSASFEQKDPLVVYKMEAYNLFENYINKVNEEVSSYLMKGKLYFRSESGELEEAVEQKTDLSNTSTNRSAEDNARRRAAAQAGRGRRQVETVRRTEKKVGRNEPVLVVAGKNINTATDVHKKRISSFVEKSLFDFTDIWPIIHVL